MRGGWHDTRTALRRALIAACVAASLVTLTSALPHADAAAWEASARSYVASHEAPFHQEVLAFAAIPSVSAVPAHANDVRAAGEWTAQRLRSLGAEHVALMETGVVGEAHPVVYGDWLHAPPGAPTVLVYGHFDVQPAEPLALWTTPPFAPTQFTHPSDGPSLRARGAADDKGPLAAALQGLHAVFHASDAKAFPVNLKFLIEGQEEIGSPQLDAFVAAHAALLSADVAISADGEQHNASTPSLTVGYRGAVALRLAVRTGQTDLHSGSFGGSVGNAGHVISSILAALHGPDGAVAAPGFYDDVAELTPAERAAMAALPFDAGADLASAGVGAHFGEKGFSTLERRWVRPTAEVTGLWSGWTGEGVKTVLPAQAHATIVARLAPAQSPDKAYDALATHLLASADRLFPPGVATVNVTRLGFSAAPVAQAPASLGNAAAAEVLRELYAGIEPLLKRMGGSIPAVGIFKHRLGVDTTGLAFGHPGCGAHAPDEHIALRDLARGRDAYAAVLFRIARLAREGRAAARDEL
jgi:acetylornithine deacetylase/succinyl-diaminopimelate desuccinylase-like protein